MKKSLHIILSVVLCLSLMLPGFATTVQAVDAVSDKNVSSTATIDQNFADNRVLVVLTREASMTFTTYTANSFASLGCVSVTDLSDATGAMVKAAMEQAMETFSSRGISDLPSTPVEHSETISNYRQVLCLELNEASKENVIKTIKLLSERDDVLYAGPDYVIEFSIPETSFTAMEEIDLIDNQRAMNDVIPDDEHYDRQWGAEKISLPRAWSYTTGSSDVVVGILDTGMNGSHDDLVNNISVSLSRDFTSGTPQMVSSVSEGGGIFPTTHGTNVAGIIGAQGDNSTGIAGVCWDVTLVSLRVFRYFSQDELPSGGIYEGVTHGVQAYGSWVISAINYATSAGIDILNFSGGWMASNPSFVIFYDYGISSAISNFPGLFVCAANNDNVDVDSDEDQDLPASLNISNMIVVGASDENDTKQEISGYGQLSVDLFAPGNNIYTTSYSGYSYMPGTSLATAYVTGVAALMLAVNSDMTPSQLKHSLLITVDPVEALEDLCVSGGRLDAANAVVSALTTP